MDIRLGAERAARRSVAFLLSRQGDDGMWRDFMTPAGEASCWPTGVVVTALGAAGADQNCVARAALALISRQQPDGGWGYNGATPSDADSTAWALLALCSHLPAPDEAPARRDIYRRAAAFLQRHRRRHGGIATYATAGPIRRYTSLPRWLPFRGWCRPTIEVTATASHALHSIGVPDALDAGWRYVCSKQRDDGSWGAYWWSTPHIATKHAVRLGAARGDTDTITRAAVWARGTLTPDGPPFHSALSLSILATAAPNDRESIERALTSVLRQQREDGSWPSCPILRIPVPADTADSDDRAWRLLRFDGGLVVADQHGIFTAATCLVALRQASLALARSLP